MARHPARHPVVRALTTILCLFLVSISLTARAASENPDERWLQLKPTLFGDRDIIESDDVISLDAPKRAHDAGFVPIGVNVIGEQTPSRYIDKVHLVVDKNPVPMAGTFDFMNEGRFWSSFETRIRINEYTNVRAIAEMSDGTLHMTKKFVKASGGCSAPAMGDLAEALTRAGRMKLVVDDLLAGSADPAQAVIKISHPNNSGMQFDQVSRNYIPAFFVHTIGAQVGGKDVLKVDTNFSLSENPMVRFNFAAAAEESKMTVYAIDSTNKRYEQTFSLGAD